MREILSQQLHRDRYRDSTRAERIAFAESHVFRASIRQFGDGVEISVRDINQDRLERPMPSDVPIHLQIPKVRTEEEQAERDAENKRRSVHRAKQMVRWLSKSLQADHMWALTYRENMQDLDRVKKHWREFVRLVKARYPKFRYVCCHELQERGAWHLHVGVRGRYDIDWIRRCWWIALGHRVEIDYSPDGKKHLKARVRDSGEWRYARSDEIAGNVQMSGPRKRFAKGGTRWDTEKLAAYLSKYMSKAFEEIESGRRYWASKDIRRPTLQKIWLQAIEWRDAVKEVHDMIRSLYSCRRLHIWATNDFRRIWMSGNEVVCPF